MKKTVTFADGSQVVYEGTPDCYSRGHPWFAVIPPPPCGSPLCPLHLPQWPAYTWSSTA